MKVFSSLFLSVLLFSGVATAYEVKQNVPAHQAYPLTSPQPQLSVKQSSAIADIARRGEVRCGTNLSIKSYAYKENNIWHGFDTDICRVFAEAILGDSEKINMVHVPSGEVADALKYNKIDVMLSGSGYSALLETAHKVLNAGLLYYDYQYVLAPKDGSEDLADYKGQRMCLSGDSDYYRHFQDYNARYNFGINYLTFNSFERAREALLLKRCTLLSASGLLLYGLKNEMPRLQARVLPIKISVQPTYAVVQYGNTDLQIALKWVLNALLLAEQYGINTQNMGYFATNEDPEVRNLLGDNPQMWKNLQLQPQWLRAVITKLGNYGDIYDRNLGKESEYNLQRGEGHLLKNGGTVYPLPFI